MVFRPDNSLAYLLGNLFLLLSAHKLLYVIHLGAFRHGIRINKLAVVLYWHVLHGGI
jgi:hypothetical protein